ncbi:hypothetical protein BDN67DRAFT_960649 [Paxillus ammoniavirescens]|nr:hypothetical protein BDN67DRAFT_960649 [Paxillus ammoniavirescens]
MAAVGRVSVEYAIQFWPEAFVCHCTDNCQRAGIVQSDIGLGQYWVLVPSYLETAVNAY